MRRTFRLLSLFAVISLTLSAGCAHAPESSSVPTVSVDGRRIEALTAIEEGDERVLTVEFETHSAAERVVAWSAEFYDARDQLVNSATVKKHGSVHTVRPRHVERMEHVHLRWSKALDVRRIELRPADFGSGSAAH